MRLKLRSISIRQIDRILATLANQIRTREEAFHIYIKCKRNLNEIAFEMEKKKKRGKVKIRGIDGEFFCSREGRKKNGGHLFYVRSINHFKWLFQQLNDFK